MIKKDEDKPMFYKVSQITDEGREIMIFKKPIFCTGRTAIKLSIENCVFEDNIAYIKAEAVSKKEQEILFEEATEEELKEYKEKKSEP